MSVASSTARDGGEAMSGLCVPQQYHVIDIEDEGSGSLVALEALLCGSSKPRNCSTPREQNSSGERRAKVSRICDA